MTAFIQTYTGIPFFPLTPHEEDISIEDIAHALSMQCRYNGHVSRFYCPTPDQRILTADLRWVPAGDLKIGDPLLGFDEEATELASAGKRRRKWRPSEVKEVVPVKRRIIRLEMEDGSTVRSSAEHPWLVSRWNTWGNQEWATAENILDGLHGTGQARIVCLSCGLESTPAGMGKHRKASGHSEQRETEPSSRRVYMNNLMPAWEEDDSYLGGWMAGMLDGEGTVSMDGSVQVSIAQNYGPVLDKIHAGLTRGGFSFTEGRSRDTCAYFTITGGLHENLRLLGTYQPLRLINKFQRFLQAGDWAGSLASFRGHKMKEVVAAHEEGFDWVTGIETSTHTYVCEGYGAHNSVAEHCVILSHAVRPEHARWALLHDAAEAYLGDMVWPLKEEIPAFKMVEGGVMGVICARFGLDLTQPDEVTEYDRRIVIDEATELMAPAQLPWPALEGFDPLGVEIEGWSPFRAEVKYMNRFEQLFTDI